ncbi:unnamed protein product [Caenorhabditis bovis]|uniref:SH3 domain-containing protein n=1 Tax=Caenorhabditis bovis TaxID=2654633 RepID=A0A8S1EMI6_9PELO|nr:unnamed protein product [Caenorhabditis bovis]
MVPPPVPPKPSSAISSNNENIDNSSFSVSAAKALFEAAKKPEIRNAAIAAAKNPFVRQAAKNVAQDEKARNAVLNAVKEPNSSNKVTAAFAVAGANRNANSAPPPPPHRATSNDTKPQISPGKLSGVHSAIRSQLENLHLGGTSSRSPVANPAPASSIHSSNPQTTSSFSSYQSSSSYSPAPPPPPHHSTRSAPISSAITYQSNAPHGIAQYSYYPAQSDEISLTVGDKVLLKKKIDDQWVYGENTTNGQTGIVPLAYLQVIVPLADVAPSYTQTASSQIYATAIYDYNSGQPGDLTFFVNDSILVHCKINDDWLEGELLGNRGIFPKNFVNCPRIDELQYKNPAAVSFSQEKVAAAYDYFSGVADDLQFREGDIITIIEHVDNDWLMGELNGRCGLLPKSFLGPPYGSPKKVKKGIAEISSAFSPKKAIATGDYHSDDSKHLYVTKGDQLLIVEDVDEYYYKGKLESFKTLPAGILPKNIVKFVN